MSMIVRTSKQLGAALRRIRRSQSITQQALGDRMHARQATVSKLEAGEPATQLRILLDAMAALNLELVIRPRTSAPADEVEDLF
jgi:HTH-type transcriptional regulator / antitoxin HipB